MHRLRTRATVLIVPGLRDHVADHWQTLLAAHLEKVVTVPPLAEERLSCRARIEAITGALSSIAGPVILVAHSAGVLMVAHWAAQFGVQKRGEVQAYSIQGALLVTPPDLEASWPAQYPSPQAMEAGG